MDWKEFIISRNDRRFTGEFGGLVPKSGLFLESLAGLSLNKMANTASYESGAQMIERLSRQAGAQTFDDALERMNCTGALKMIAVTIPPLFTGARFADTYVPMEKGLVATKYNHHHQALSTFRITKIHLLANDTVSGKVVAILDGPKRIEFVVSIVAGVPYVLDVVDPNTGRPFYMVEHPERFSVVWDTSNIRPAALGWANTGGGLGGCGGCGGSRQSVSGQDWYWLSEANGIAVDMAYVCDYSRAAAVISHDLRWAILQRLGVLICGEILASDRINYFVNNSKEWAAGQMEKWEADYTLRLNQVLPSMDRVLRAVDRNCFYTKGNFLQELRA